MLDTLDEKRRFAQLLVALSDYYDKEISKGVMGLYWEGLRQYDYEAIEKAAWAHTQSPDENGRWFPKISDLSKVLQGRTTDQSQVAWSKVDRAVRCIGTYADVAFDDPLIHRVISDMGGWIILGQKDNDAWPFTQNEFENRYRGYKMRGDIPEYPGYLVGLTRSQNTAAGLQTEMNVRLIGDSVAAVRVIKKGGSASLELSKSWTGLLQQRSPA